MGKNNKRIDDEALFERAAKFETRGSFAKNDKSAYQILYKRKLLDKACAHMVSGLLGERHPNFKHDFKSLETKASECGTKKEFRDRYPSEYVTACRLGIIDLICAHMVNSNPKGDSHKNRINSFTEMENAAKICKDKVEFKKKYPSLYMSAYRAGILDKICSHMPELKGENSPLSKNSDLEVIEMASKYETKGEFLISNPNLYKIAFKRKLFDKINFSKQDYVGTSIQENNLFDIIKTLYPKTQKLKIRKIKIDNSPQIYGFDIDIYIPELRKGIEFDGTYYHSFEGLKRSRKNWPDEDILNYHQIKDSYFLSKGIQILHIKEKDWLKNKQECIDRCLEFLDVSNEKVA